VAYAKEKGVDFIICDHHRPGDTLPDAVAVLDPKVTIAITHLKNYAAVEWGLS
jgi:single-stranded DNA-specific DHH superfamily exonuclease